MSDPAIYVDTYNKSAIYDAVMLFFVFFLFFLFISIIISALIIVSQWKIFKKARRNGWEAIIPFYNSYVLFEISGYPGWYIFLGFIPFIGSIILLVLQIMAYLSLSKKFHKNEVFGILMVFFPYICYPILAFSDVTYDEKLGTQRNTSNTSSNEENKQEEIKKEVNYCSNCGNKLRKNAKKCPKCEHEI